MVDGPAAEEIGPKRVYARYPVTPDGRYFVVRGRLWRMADPRLAGDEREKLVKSLWPRGGQ